MSIKRILSTWILGSSLILLSMVENGLSQDWSCETTTTSEWHAKSGRDIQTAPMQSIQSAQSASYESRDLNNQGQVQATSYNSYTHNAYSQEQAAPARVSRTYRNADAIATTPRTSGRQRIVRVSDEEVVPPGEIQYEPIASEGSAFQEEQGDSASDDGECDSCGDGCRCGPKQDAYGYECFDGHIDCWWIRDLKISVGVDGFKGPRDRNQNGNFGTHEGIEMAGPLGDPWNFGYQVGVNFEQSNFSGTPSSVGAADRKQTFVTAGFFRRAEVCGLQSSVVYDYLHDNYDEKVDLQQIRSETSILFNNVNEIGYSGTYGVSSDRIKSGRIKVEPTDMFALFFRRYFENGGDGRLWGGATAYGDGLVGVDMWLPLGKSFALENAFTYVIPKQGTGTVAQQREAWGLSMSLVWYPGRSASCQQHNPYRPMLRTADNTMFLIDRTAQ